LEVFAMNMLPAGRVVIGLDGSLAAYSALRYAVAEARRRGAVLIVVRAYAPAAVRGMPDATLTREAVDEVGQAFAEAMGAMPRDLDVRLLTRVGEPGPSLIAVADGEADLIVIGGSRPDRFRWRRAGRIAAYCAARASCPVVVVPPPGLARSGRPRQLERAAARYAEQFLNVTESPRPRDRTEGVS